MSSKAAVSAAASRWIMWFSFILNIGVEAGSVISSVSDDLVAAVG
jgi:hypothetical protein